MSDHTAVLTVALDETYSVDDAECIINAIKMIKGVLSVGVNVADIGTYTAYSQARFDLEKKMFEALREKK